VTTNGSAHSRTANAQNEVTQVGGSSLAYSRTGNLTTDAQGRTLVYDGWNRLVSVKNAAGVEIARYEYDGLNRRIVEQVGTAAVPAAASAPVRDSYYSQDWQVLEERVRTSTGAIPATADTRFIWSPVYVDALIARDRNADANATTGTGGLEERVYALQDANWNTTAIVAASGVPGVTGGTVVSRFAYTPYGESQTLTASWEPPAAGTTPATPWAHLFQGLEFTDVTGLAHARNRDYSASLGRFITLDPIGFQAGDNNWYRFVANGPTGKVDPSGLEACTSKYPGTAISVDALRRLSNGTNVTEDFIQRHADFIAGILVKRVPGFMRGPVGIAKLAANLPLILARLALFANSSDRQIVGFASDPTGKISVRYLRGGMREEKLIPNSNSPVIYKGPCPGRAMGCWKEEEIAKNWCDFYDSLYEAYELLLAIQKAQSR